MNVFIAGGGRVGFHLASLLSADKHDVTVIEINPERCEQVDLALDVKTVTGNVASLILLKESGAGDADLFVAATGNDEANLVAAASAKALGAGQAVARVDNPVFVDSSMLYEAMLGIDYVLSPEALAALEVVKFIETPGLVATEEFGRGLIRMRQIRVNRTPTRGGKTLRDVCPPGGGVLVATINRNGDTLVPHGDDVVEKGDIITLVGHREKMPEIEKLFHGAEARPRTVAIMGGLSIGSHLARGLERNQRAVTLMDVNAARCKELAALLPKTNVVCRDANSRTALEEEGVVNADVFVATTNDDERNIMASVLAKELGVKQSVAVVHHPDFAGLVTKLGIDHAVTPRACLAGRILKLLHRERVTSVAVLEGGQAEIQEHNVDADSPIVGRKLASIRFPPQALITTILRGDQVIVPGGQDEVQAGDTVIVIARSESLESIRKLF